MEQPAVSVIVPVFNAEMYLSKCVESLLHQTLTDIEFIFVNDGSKDRSLSILENILSSYPAARAKIVNHPKNLGLAQARLTGIAAATGKYIGFCDADDWVEPEMFEQLYGFATNGDYDIAVTSYYNETTEGSFVEEIRLPDTGPECVDKFLRGELTAYMWNKLFKAELFEKLTIKGIRNYWEDLCFAIQLFFHAPAIGLLKGNPLYHYNLLNTASITAHVSPSKIDEMIQNVQLMEQFLVENNLNTDSLTFRKVRCKSLMSVTNHRTEEWNRIFPEVNLFLLENVKVSPVHKILIKLLNKQRHTAYHKLYAVSKCMKRFLR